MGKSRRKSVATATENAPVVDVVDVATVVETAPVVDVVDAPVDAPVETVDASRIAILDVIDRIEGAGNDASWFRHREMRNGIPVPKGWGLCARAWYLFDDLFAQGITDTASVIEVGATLHGLNRGNLRTEISRYRKYHGIAREGRKVTVAPIAVVNENELNPNEG